MISYCPKRSRTLLTLEPRARFYLAAVLCGERQTAREAHGVLPLPARLLHVQLRLPPRRAPAEAGRALLEVLAPELQRRLHVLGGGAEARAHLLAQRRRSHVELRLDQAQHGLDAGVLDVRRGRA